MGKIISISINVLLPAMIDSHFVSPQLFAHGLMIQLIGSILYFLLEKHIVLPESMKKH